MDDVPGRRGHHADAQRRVGGSLDTSCTCARPPRSPPLKCFCSAFSRFSRWPEGAVARIGIRASVPGAALGVGAARARPSHWAGTPEGGSITWFLLFPRARAHAPRNCSSGARRGMPFSCFAWHNPQLRLAWADGVHADDQDAQLCVVGDDVQLSTTSTTATSRGEAEEHATTGAHLLLLFPRAHALLPSPPWRTSTSTHHGRPRRAPKLPYTVDRPVRVAKRAEWMRLDAARTPPASP